MRDHDWPLRAACRGQDPNIFFPDHRESHAKAKAFCNKCSVREECLEEAIEYESLHCFTVYGIWGGKTTFERKKIIREKRRANPQYEKTRALVASLYKRRTTL